MRVAFTIILNGLHHLQHKDYYQTILNTFDKWIVVEGVALPGGSTSWCKHLPPDFHRNFLSNDGTTEFLDQLETENPGKLKVIRKWPYSWWDSKDEQVNAAILYLGTITKECFLWQIDVDEQWTPATIAASEETLKKHNGKTGMFYCDYYVGPNQLAVGEWGEGRKEPYRRLWQWRGELFSSHEPPKLQGNNGPGMLLSLFRFKHYAYYFEKDVKFKEKYYGGYGGLYERWLNVQKNKDTIPIKALLGPSVWWSNTNTQIIYNNETASRR